MAKSSHNTNQGRIVLWCAVLILAVWFILQVGSISHHPIHEIESTGPALDLPLEPELDIEHVNTQGDDTTAWLSSLLVERTPGDSVPGWYDLSTINLLDNNQQLSPRGKLVKEGLIMRCMMIAQIGVPGSDEHVPQSDFVVFRDLYEEYGWDPDMSHNKVLGETPFNVDTSWFDQIGVSADRARWTTMSNYHAGNAEWETTQGQYTNHVNLQDGMIIAASNWSPAYMVENEDLGLTPEQIVPLQRWSDVAWLTYNHWLEFNIQQARPTKLLEHVIRYHIKTPAVKTMLQDITGTDVEHVGTWPGRSYPILTSEALAILGLPHGKGVGWFLAQHKLNLGVRTVDRINVFNCPKFPDGDAQWCIYMHIVPA
ncbi:hypothetical protein CB0940_03902 [Cercospora beticola]|uniref:Uncharacterized protein n=1 Tax=Cercospora beticola TaxID=122368 RepID=A0A2G5HLU2_CERBT|nr:hypothetical protein CB0940_03902 [Cercospora beticola]PIA93495.1 hypothetical protein CB0940_03902 [Cercospora beticola]WPB01104.1 hypothetical protein RHO25_005725 [Cercospora beticola]CAK1364152.1 unnamed protein product [Cercospora beticola]